jgi:hypothetical protein
VSNTNDYIITTLSSGSTEYTNLSNAAIQAPFSLGIPTARTLRSTGAPYVSTLGNPSNIFTREVITPSGGGGGGIPASITARDNLLHWWKMSDGSTTSATDYGLSASSGVTDLTLDGVTSVSGGPSELGSPNAISFDGVNDVAWVKIVDSGGTNSTIGDLFDESHGQGMSISMWVKDDASTRANYSVYWVGTTSNSWNDGMGTYFFSPGTTLFFWLNPLWNGYRTSEPNTLPHSGWRNIIMTYPDKDTTSRFYKVYYDGSEVASYGAHSATIPNTTINSVANAKLSFASYVRPDGTSAGHVDIVASDIRLYNKVLTTDEISDIAAGDYT